MFNNLSTLREPRRDFRLQTSDLRRKTSDVRPQTSDFRLQTSDFRLQISELRLQTLGTSLPIFHSLLLCTNMDDDVSRFAFITQCTHLFLNYKTNMHDSPRSRYRHSFCFFSVKGFERNKALKRYKRM